MGCAVLEVLLSESVRRGGGSRTDLGQNHNAKDFYVTGRTDFLLESGGQWGMLGAGTLLGDAGISLSVRWCSSWPAMERRQEMSQGLGDFCLPSHCRQSFILLL